MWQEIKITPTDPSAHVADDYAVAEVTAVWLRHATHGSRLVFAIVEMLVPSAEGDPTDRLQPAPSLRLPRCGDELLCGRAHLTPQSAIAWYRSCLEGRSQLPGELIAGGVAETVSTGSLVDEPAWPAIPFENRPFWEHTELWGTRPGGVRRHQLVQIAPEEVIANWTDDDSVAARAWLASRLPVDIFAAPFLFGSVHLILPNPLFSAAAERLGNNDDSQLFFEITPHPGQSVVGLEVFFKEKRPGATTAMTHFTLEHERARLTFAYRPNDTQFAICCPRRGLLYDSPTSGFVAEIRGIGRLAGRRRRVTVPGSRRRAEERFDVDVTEHDFPINAGEPIGRGVAKVSEFFALKDEDAQGRMFQQHWFDGDRERATEFIRGLIQSANHSVYMVDPYFGAIELLRFASAATRSALPVRVLAAEDYLQRSSTVPDPSAPTCTGCARPLPPSVSPQTHGEVLEQQLRHLLNQDPTLSIEVRVALGDPAPIHDRFLCIDETVRTLGSSLNEFGSRGTMMMNVPAPREIRVRLEAAWNAGESLSGFNLRRAATAPTTSPGTSP